MGVSSLYEKAAHTENLTKNNEDIVYIKKSVNVKKVSSLYSPQQKKLGPISKKRIQVNLESSGIFQFLH